MNYWPVFLIAIFILCLIFFLNYWDKHKKLKHKKRVEKYYGSLEDLAIDVGNLHYESLQFFFKSLSEKIERDAKNDSLRGRVKLASELEKASKEILAANNSIEKAAIICKPYIK